MYSVLVFCFLFVTVANAALYNEVVDDQWQNFKTKFQKKYYNDIEERFRSNIFKDNVMFIDEHNELYDAGKLPYQMTINKFADMLEYELKINKKCYNEIDREHLKTSKYMPSRTGSALPKEFDWRTKGAVTPVKDQGNCEACWAFAATGTIEGQHFLKTNQLVALSEQNLIDCANLFNDSCKDGGSTLGAYMYTRFSGGLDTEDSYPYQNKEQEKCHFNNKTIGASIRGYMSIAKGNETELMEAVARVGPISVSVDALHKSFLHYSNGVYDEANCSSDNLNHVMLLIGYGTADNGDDYWLLKNSWGADWGDEGYIKMARNKENQCGIANEAIYPLV